MTGCWNCDFARSLRWLEPTACRCGAQVILVAGQRMACPVCGHLMQEGSGDRQRELSMVSQQRDTGPGKATGLL